VILHESLFLARTPLAALLEDEDVEWSENSPAIGLPESCSCVAFRVNFQFPSRSGANRRKHEPLVISPSAAVDENLFFVRVLAAFYDSISDSRNTSEQELMDGLERVKQGVGWWRGVIQASGLDARVGGLCDDCIEDVTACETFLTRRGVIEKQSNRQALENLGGSLWKGYQDGSDIASDAARLGASGKDVDEDGEVVCRRF
jgi:hypothetical protein